MSGAVLALALVVAGCGTGSGTNYTTVSLSANCDNSSSIAFGQGVDDIVQIQNTSGHNWAATYAFIDRQGDFRLDNASMSNAPSTDLGGDSYNLGPLANGDIGDLHIHMTASKAQALASVKIQVWGSSKSITDSSASLSIPDRAETSHCDHTIQ
ncbi:MAG: hypothetical protein M3Y17_10725 [Actinomycetota bacterium]|nr:hypothetical protein [Actinomycetota bacterium]